MTSAFIYLAPGASITYCIASAQPTSPPPASTCVTFTQPSAANFPGGIEEPLNGGQMLYITAFTAGSTPTVGRFL